MSWQVVATHAIAKNETKGSEDNNFSASNLHVVFDGVSSGLDPQRPAPTIEGMTPGQFAVQTGLAAIENAVASYRDRVSFVQALSEALADAIKQQSGDIGKPAYVFAVFLPEHDIIIQVGDCPVMIDGVVYASELWFDVAKARIRRWLLQHQVARGKSVDELVRSDPTKPIMEWITQNLQFRCTNLSIRPFGYGVIDGQSVPDCHINVIPVSADAKRILLATDGFPPTVLDHDPPTMLQKMEQLLAEDPLCIDQWPAVRGIQPNGRWPDDATSLWLERV